MNLETGVESEKYINLIGSLEKLEKKFSQEDFDWLNSESRTLRFGSKNHPLHLFIFCIDWGALYNSNSRITIYDILIASNTLKRSARLDSFSNSYKEIRKLFDGEILTVEDLVSCRKTIKGGLSNGLNYLLGIDENGKRRRKGLNEFLILILNELATPSYESVDFEKPTLIGESQSSKFKDNLFQRFLPAFDCAVIFNSNYRSNLSDVKVDDFFALHVLLRHVVPFKLQWNSRPNPNSLDRIKNGYGKNVNVTAHTTENGTTVISSDGHFFGPNLLINQDEYREGLSKGISLEKIIEPTAESLYKRICELLPILKENINGDFSPNIIYHNDVFFGLEFNKQEYRENQVIVLGSFYPLNGEHQVSNGISETEYNQIINKQDIPDSNEFKINYE
jgi:hypothetical protein